MMVVASVLCGAGLVIAVVWAVWFSSVLAVTSVRVVGVQGAAADSVLSTAHIPVGIPLARLDAPAAAADLRALDWIQAVDVRRGWPHEVVIAVTPKAVVATLPTGASVAADGSTFELPLGAAAAPVADPVADSVADPVAAAPVARVPVVTAGGDALAEAMKVMVSLPDDLAARIKSLSAKTPDSVNLDLRGGALVHWGSADKATEKVQVLRSLLVHRADVYDVSSPELPTIWRRG